MIDAYRVGISMVVESNASTALDPLIRAFEKLQSVVKDTQATVNGLVSGIRAITRSGDSAAASWQRAATAMERAAKAGEAARRAMPTPGVGAGAASTGETATSGRAARAESIPAAPLLLTYGNTQRDYASSGDYSAPYRGPQRLLGYSGGGFSTQGQSYASSGGALVPWTGFPTTREEASSGAYSAPYSGPQRLLGYDGPSTGFTTSGGAYTPQGGALVAGGGTGGGGGIPLNLAGATLAQRMRYVFQGAGGRIMANAQNGSGANGILGGYVTYEALKHVFDAGAELENEQAKLATMGFTPAQVSSATAEADRVRRASPGTTLLGNLEIARDANSIVQNPRDAIGMVSSLARMGVVLGGAGKSGDIQELFQAAQAGELRGALSKNGQLDIAGFQRYLRATEAVTTATGGRIGPREYVGFLRQAGIAGVRADDQFLFGDAPAMMFAMGAQRAGTAMQSLSQVEFGHIGRAYGEEQERIGLAKQGSYIRIPGSASGYFAKGGLNNGDLMQSNLLRYVQQQLLPSMNTSGITQQKDQLTELYRLYPRSTITRAMEDLIRNMPQIQREEGGITARIKAGDPYNTYTANNPVVQEKALGASWQAFLASASSTAMPAAIKALNAITGALDHLNDWAKANPGQAKTVIEGMAAALGLFAVGKVANIALVTLAGKGPGGLLALAGGIELLGKGMLNLPSWLVNMASGAAVGGRVGGVGGAITGAGVGLGYSIAGNPFALTLPKTPGAGEHYEGGQFNPFNPLHVVPDAQFKKESYITGAPMANERPIVIQNITYLDGKVVAQSVTDHQAKAANRPPRGPNYYDGTMSVMRPSLVGA